MSLPRGRQCLISGEPLAHLLHNTLGSAALPRWQQPVCNSSSKIQRPVYASAGVLERSAPAEASSRDSLTSLADSVRSGKRRAVDVAEEYLQRIERLDPQVLSYLAVNREGALAAARSIDEKVAAGSGAALGSLAGVPISIKDNILTQGIETTAASNILSGAWAICSCDNYPKPDTYMPMSKARTSEKKHGSDCVGFCGKRSSGGWEGGKGT